MAGTRVDCSLDTPLGEADDNSLADLVAAPTAHQELEDLLALPGLLARLPQVEHEVLTGRRKMWPGWHQLGLGLDGQQERRALVVDLSRRPTPVDASARWPNRAEPPWPGRVGCPDERAGAGSGRQG